MALIKGLLASYSDPILGLVPTTVLFQYNPTEMTRVLRVESRVDDGGSPTGAALNAVRAATEEYSMKLEFDATDGLERGGPLTLAFGISPRLAALELLMQPVGASLLGGLASTLTRGLLGGGGANVPAGQLPLTLFVWGPERIAPVRLNTLSIQESAFDELLNPIQATADVSFSVLRFDDPMNTNKFARAAAKYYQGSRETRALLAPAQIPELL